MGFCFNAVQNFMIQAAARAEAIKSRDRGAVLSRQLTAVDTKVESVAEQTNGHMTQLIAAVAPVDPVMATAAALKIVETAEKAAEKLKQTACEAARKKLAEPEGK